MAVEPSWYQPPGSTWQVGWNEPEAGDVPEKVKKEDLQQWLIC